MALCTTAPSLTLSTIYLYARDARAIALYHFVSTGTRTTPGALPFTTLPSQAPTSLTIVCHHLQAPTRAVAPRGRGRANSVLPLRNSLHRLCGTEGDTATRSCTRCGTRCRDALCAAVRSQAGCLALASRLLLDLPRCLLARSAFYCITAELFLYLYLNRRLTYYCYHQFTFVDAACRSATASFLL